MGQTPHYFIAIPLTDKLTNEFSLWQGQLRENLSYKIWPQQADLHITLKFLGAVEQDLLERLRNSLRSIAQTTFSVDVGSIGTFGKHDSPRVLWAGVEKNEPIEELYKKVENAVITVGFAKENRPYRPHITLAKKWTGTEENAKYLKEIREKYDKERFHMIVEEFVLYQIFPSRSPKYERVETYRLRG